MFDIIFKTLVTFLTIYALMDIFIRFVEHIFDSEPEISKDMFVVIKVVNQEERLEGIVRSIIWKELNVENSGSVPNIVIVDMGSEDCTRLIGERLADDYSFIYYVTSEEYEKFKDDFGRNNRY